MLMEHKQVSGFCDSSGLVRHLDWSLGGRLNLMQYHFTTMFNLWSCLRPTVYIDKNRCLIDSGLGLWLRLGLGLGLALGLG